MTSKASKWREHVEGWRASGQSAAAYCAERGLKVWSLRYWSQRIRDQERPDAGNGLAVRSVHTSVRLAQVRAKRAEPAGLAAGVVQVSAGALVLQVAPGFDHDALREVLSVVLDVVEARR